MAPGDLSPSVKYEMIGHSEERLVSTEGAHRAQL